MGLLFPFAYCWQTFKFPIETRTQKEDTRCKNFHFRLFLSLLVLSVTSGDEQAEGVRAEDARENMWTYGGKSDGRMVNTARVSALLPAHTGTGLPLPPPPHTGLHNSDY